MRWPLTSVISMAIDTTMPALDAWRFGRRASDGRAAGAVVS